MIELDVDALIGSGKDFAVTIENDGVGSVTVTLTLAVGGQGRSFSVDGSAKADKQNVKVGPATSRSVTISSWGTGTAGQRAEVHAESGADKTDGHGTIS